MEGVPTKSRTRTRTRHDNGIGYILERCTNFWTRWYPCSIQQPRHGHTYLHRTMLIDSTIFNGYCFGITVLLLSSLLGRFNVYCPLLDTPFVIRPTMAAPYPRDARIFQCLSYSSIAARSTIFVQLHQALPLPASYQYRDQDRC